MAEGNEAAGLRRCPWCAEMIQPMAKICRYCQRDVKPLEAMSGPEAGSGVPERRRSWFGIQFSEDAGAGVTPPLRIALYLTIVGAILLVLAVLAIWASG